jgi:hypothetical protein
LRRARAGGSVREIQQVSARDKATGKERQIRIRVSGGLSDDEIRYMRADAQRVGISQIILASPVNIVEATPKQRRSDEHEPPPAVVSPHPVFRATGAKPGVFLSYAHEDEKWAVARADGHGMRVMRNHRILGEDAHHDQEAR